MRGHLKLLPHRQVISQRLASASFVWALSLICTATTGAQQTRHCQRLGLWLHMTVTTRVRLSLNCDTQDLTAVRRGSPVLGSMEQTLVWPRHYWYGQVSCSMRAHRCNYFRWVVERCVSFGCMREPSLLRSEVSIPACRAVCFRFVGFISCLVTLVVSEAAAPSDRLAFSTCSTFCVCHPGSPA